MADMKKVQKVISAPARHWVGDGFPVSTVFSPQTVQAKLSPYILFDYAAQARFEPAGEPRGVDVHPHRGFETVTVVYQGELEHRDSAGNKGSIGPGDVQWMTAASGVLHEEKHSRAFTRNGGLMEMAQLWVNLPAALKMSKPKYQELLRDRIPTIELKDDAGVIRVIAGQFNDTAGAARTHTPVILWDLHLNPSAKIRLPAPEGYTLGIFVRSGTVRVGASQTAGEQQLVVLETAGQDVLVEAESAADLLILGGEPIDEPLVAYGPFVMNTKEEIQTALDDLRNDRFGQLV